MEKNGSALTDRMDEVEKAIEAVAKEISKDFKGQEKNVYDLAAKRVLDQHGDNRILCNRAKRLLTLLDEKGTPMETRIAFMAMSMGVPGMGEPSKSFREALEWGERRVGGLLTWSSLAEGLDKGGKIMLTTAFTGIGAFAGTALAAHFGQEKLGPVVITAIGVATAAVLNALSHLTHAFAGKSARSEELAIDELMNAAKSEVMTQLERYLPKDWMKLYNYGLVDMDETTHLTVTDERYVRDVAEAVRGDLEKLHGRPVDVAMYDRKSLEADINAVFRMNQEKEIEKSRMDEKENARAEGRKEDIWHSRQENEKMKAIKGEGDFEHVENTEWVAKWASARLRGEERDIVKKMMEIAKKMDGPDKGSVKIHADRAISLCNRFYGAKGGKEKDEISLEIKKEVIRVASLLPCGGVPEAGMKEIMDNTARTRWWATFTGTFDTVGSPVAKMMLGAIATVSFIISAISRNRNERMQSQIRDALNAVKYCVSVELERPVLPDRFDELYAEGFADARNGKIVITASDECLDEVADVLRENALDELGIRIDEKDMTRERLQEIARMIVSNRREKLHYPKITVSSLDDVQLKQKDAESERAKGVLKVADPDKAQQKTAVRMEEKDGSKEMAR